jgi:Tol biopolymer transport system component
VVTYAQATQITSDSGLTIDPAISHNGRMLAYASDRHGDGNLAIWIRTMRGGETTRLTKGNFHETGPDFSPDDSQVVYRSDRDGGGIYIAPVAGGSEPKLLAPNGWRPRFSPDGKSVAYFVLAGSADDDAATGLGQIFIVPVTGGAARRIAPEIRVARYPVWSPDSKHLLFEGTRTDMVSDWFVIPLEGGELVRTLAFEAMSKIVRVRGIPDQWVKNRVLFSAASDQMMHIWQIPLSDKFEAGTPKQITNGAGREGPARAGNDSRFYFANTTRTIGLWKLRLDANLSKVMGNLEQINKDDAIATVPTLSANGKRLAYVSTRSGVPDVWVGDADGGNEQAITRFRRVGFRPVLSEDGGRVIFPTMSTNNCAVIVSNVDGAPREGQLNECLGIWDWSRDRKSLLVFSPLDPNHSIDMLQIDSRARHMVVSHTNRSVFSGEFSPDGKWIVFTSGEGNGQAQLFVAPVGPGKAGESNWIPIAKDHGTTGTWSPDGNVLYYRSSRDGFHCIWAQRLSPGKAPVGEPVAIQHFHSASFGVYLLKTAEFRIAVSGERMVLNVGKHNGNLWTADLE